MSSGMCINVYEVSMWPLIAKWYTQYSNTSESMHKSWKCYVQEDGFHKERMKRENHALMFLKGQGYV